MAILSSCISKKYSEQNSLVASSLSTERIRREHTYPSKSRELSSCKTWRRWEVQSDRLGFQRNYLESYS